VVSTVVWNPSGATPITVSGLPFTGSSPTTAASPLNRRFQN
jgi:hypothetical protein